MLIYIILGIAALIVLLLIVIVLQPNSFRVERRATIPAPPAEVFAQVQDLHKWQAWSPWENIDPELKRTYSGSPAGWRRLRLGRQSQRRRRPHDDSRMPSG